MDERRKREKREKKRVVIAGGGTGGHIFPAVAIANALKKKDPEIEILFIGAKGKMEMEKVPQAGYPIEGLDITGFNRSSLIKNIWLPFRIVKSFFQVSRIFRTFRPQAAIGVGGYSTYPVLRYAQARGISTFIHESNSFAGKSNMLLGKKATRIFVAGEGMERFFPADRIIISGNPVRASIAGPLPSREEALTFFGLQAGKKTVFVTGGSLGAKNINEAIAASLPLFAENGLQLIWQTGAPFAPVAAEASAGMPNVRTSGFVPNMEIAFAAADIVVSRAGAMTIAELCMVRKPVIFVPYPFAAEDHQTVNAMRLVDRNAALMLNDSEVKEKLAELIVSLAADEKKQEELKKNIGELAIKEADERIATEILKSINDEP